MLFIDQLLKDRHTRLKFNGYMSDWVGVDNSIVQGDPLSMILYLFYNADLIDNTKKGEAKIAYVDDANYYVEGSSFKEAYDKLRDMMSREGGGQDWSRWHNLWFEASKLTLVGFSRRCAPDPACPGKLMPEPRPDFTLGTDTVKLATSHKFLGVLFDQELHWKEQAERVVAKATKWSLCARRLARHATGISPRQMWQLYQAVAVPSFMYAVDVWFTPVDRTMGGQVAKGLVGTARKLRSVQWITTMAITGALRTSATDVMEVHAILWPIELLFHRICHRATLQLTAILESHPLTRQYGQ